MSSGELPRNRVLVVSAVYNNETTIEELQARLDASARCAGIDAKYLFVDDGSRDGSWSVIRRLAAEHETVAGLRLDGNFGQTRALCAGLESSPAEVVVYIDADLEIPPETIRLLAPAIAAGHDFVGGARSPRDRRALRWLAAQAFNALTRACTGLDVHDVGCGLVAMRQNVVAAVVEAMRRRPVQIIKPTMMFAATDPIEVPIPSAPPSASSHPSLALLRFAIEFVLLEASLPSSVRATRRGPTAGGADRGSRIARAVLKVLAASMPSTRRGEPKPVGELYLVGERVGWIESSGAASVASRP